MRQFIVRIFISTHATPVMVIPNMAKLDKAMSWLNVELMLDAGCRYNGFIKALWEPKPGTLEDNKRLVGIAFACPCYLLLTSMSSWRRPKPGKLLPRPITLSKSYVLIQQCLTDQVAARTNYVQ